MISPRRSAAPLAPTSVLAFALALGAAALPAQEAGEQRPGERAPRTDFVERPGEREFSGRMIARPVQYETLRSEGLSHVDAQTRVAGARLAMAVYAVAAYVPQTDEYVFELPAGENENAAASALLATGNFEYVEPDWTLYPIGCPDDPLLGNQWHHEADIMDSCAGWDLHTGGPSVGVGICDTGILTSHQDFQLHRLEGYNAVDQQWESAGGNIGPVHPHGTNTTGCAAANGDNGVGVSGVGWNLSHRMMRVSNSSGGGSSLSTLQHAARTSIEAGDRVASVSYSGVDNSSNLTTATYIKSIGGLLVWAAGNDGRNLTFGDRDADDIIVAGATDSNDNLAYFTAYGPFVDVTAPGVSVYTTHSSSSSSYASVSGTSFSCPLTAGLCALIWSADPSLTPDEVEDILKQGTDDLGAAGPDNSYGHGRIDVLGALTLVGGGGAPPTAAFTGTPTAGVAPLTVAFTDESSGAPTAWAWDFGDGGTSTATNPSHTYTAAGVYTVSLTVTNAGGADTLTRTNYITVDPDLGDPPVADFVGVPTSGTAPLTAAFTDLSTNAPTSWAWDFGDGGSSSAENPSHTYTAAGVYTVSLTVANAAGSDTQTLNGYITVDPGGGGPIFSDGFESGSFAAGGWTQANKDARVHSRAAFTGGFGALLKASTGIEVAVDATSRTGVTLSYARRTQRYDGGESLVVEWYDGASWNLVEATAATSWGTTTVALGPLADDNPDLRIRFTTNANHKREHAHIDDVLVDAD